jgi:hypothetical protein
MDVASDWSCGNECKSRCTLHCGDLEKPNRRTRRIRLSIRASRLPHLSPFQFVMLRTALLLAIATKIAHAFSIIDSRLLSTSYLSAKCPCNVLCHTRRSIFAVIPTAPTRPYVLDKLNWPLHSSQQSSDSSDVIQDAAQTVKNGLRETVREVSGGQDLLAECFAIVTVRI